MSGSGSGSSSAARASRGSTRATPDRTGTKVPAGTCGAFIPGRLPSPRTDSGAQALGVSPRQQVVGEVVDVDRVAGPAVPLWTFVP
jgi:hypothetical protein